MVGDRKFPSDLLLIAGLVILTDIFVLLPALSGSLIRTALGLPLLLFLPGYALISMLFPEKNGLEGMERIALSVAMSVSVVPLIGLALSYTSWGIKEIPLLTSFSAFTLLMLVAAYVRRRKLPADREFEVSFRALTATLISEVMGEPESKTEKNRDISSSLSDIDRNWNLRCSVPQEEPFTEFYILDPTGWLITTQESTYKEKVGPIL